MAIMIQCEACDGEGHAEHIANYGNGGWYAARAARTGDEGPCFVDEECEECNGEGEVEHKCPVCGDPHEEACCAICEGCEACCTCTVCTECGEKVEDGGDWVTWADHKWCLACVTAAHGPWCAEQEAPCVECPMAACPGAACEHWARKVADDRAAELEMKEEADANQRSDD